MTTPTRKYREAAVGYFVYGVIYLTGAIYLAQVGASPRAMQAGSFWWFVIGAVMVVAFPLLIWKEFKWITRALALLVLVRVVGLVRMFVDPDWDAVPLPWGRDISEAYGAAFFLVITLAVCSLLFRAGWAVWLERRADRAPG